MASELETDEEITKRDYFGKMLREYHDLFMKFSRSVSGPPESPGPWEDLSAYSERRKAAAVAAHRASELQRFLDFYIFSFIKSFDATTVDEDPANFYMEREWRILGNVNFASSNVSRIILPQAYADRIRQDLPEYEGKTTYAEDC